MPILPGRCAGPAQLPYALLLPPVSLVFRNKGHGNVRPARNGPVIALVCLIPFIHWFNTPAITSICNDTLTETTRGRAPEVCLHGAVIPDADTANIVLQSQANTPKSVFRICVPIADQDLFISLR